MQQVATHTGNIDDREYRNFIERMEDRFLSTEALFTTDVGDHLWDVYLNSFTSEDQQHHNCSTCRHFIEHYGGLVTIDETGATTPALWHDEDAPDDYKWMVGAMRDAVAKAKVTGEWSHYAVRPPTHCKHTHRLLTAGQVMAERREDFINVNRALSEFKPKVIDQALSLLRSDSLYRSEKTLGQAQWLKDLHTAHKSRQRNITWKHIAAAPSGFCHPRSSMIGTLLDDLAGGMDFDDVSKRFSAKMHPLRYQRPQAAPRAGSIDRAEKVIEKLGIARSLERRFARIDECQMLWSPKAEDKPPGGLFDHLRTDGSREVNARSSGGITWAKFSSKVLPNALEIDIHVPSHGNFCALVTAVHEDAPLIFQWDNPVSWYVYSGGSSASQWRLQPGWVRSVGVTLKPSSWGDNTLEHHAEGVVFLITGAGNTRGSGLAIFPEILKSELREVRSVVEAYSNSRNLDTDTTGNAAGLALMSSGRCDVRVRVKDTANVVTEYTIDRWD